jgi:hypothetical protein
VCCLPTKTSLGSPCTRVDCRIGLAEIVERIVLAKQAIGERWQQLEGSEDHHDERERLAVPLGLPPAQQRNLYDSELAPNPI